MDRGFYAFGTANYIKIESSLSESSQEDILNKTEITCKNLDDLLSAYKEDSEVSQINRQSGIAPVSISTETFNLLKRALYFSEVSKGGFDITIRPAVKLWNINKENQKIPNEMELMRVRDLVDYTSLVLDDNNQTAFLKKEGQAIDLGGIAKGYAGDCIRQELINSGVDKALINFGGTVLTIGTKADGSSWKVGIQHPHKSRGISLGSVILDDDILVTSGVYERFFIQDGIRYHHILDPRNCKPIVSTVVSVTAAGGSAMDLDGITTALFVLGLEAGIKLANELKIDALYLMENGDIIGTRGFMDGKYMLQ